jgi:hypothetical protein
MKHKTSRIGLSLLLLALMFASGAMPARAEATTLVQNIVNVPVSFGIRVACAADGMGEMVNFTGNFHYLRTFTESSGGPLHYQLTTLTQHISGVGQVTGDSYVYSGAVRESGVIAQGETMTAQYDFRVIGQGSGNNFMVHSLARYTMDDNGEMVVEFEFSDASCK